MSGGFRDADNKIPEPLGIHPDTTHGPRSTIVVITETTE